MKCIIALLASVALLSGCAASPKMSESYGAKDAAKSVASGILVGVGGYGAGQAGVILHDSSKASAK